MWKRWICCGLLLAWVIGVTAKSYRLEDIPHVQQTDARAYTSNPDGILSTETVAILDTLCQALRSEGLAQVAIVAVDEIESADTFDFAIRLFRSWGVGNAQNNNGLGVLLVEKRHEIRFVTGQGLEGALPDAICKRIQLRYMLPSFREGDYDRGMIDGMQAVASVLREEGDVLMEEDPEEVSVLGALLILGLISGWVIALVCVYDYLQRRCPKCHRTALKQTARVVTADTRDYRDVVYTYRCTECGYVLTRRRREYKDTNSGGGIFLGGTMSGGGRSFGGGGFGGGSFGGGGAGSRW